MVIYFVIYFAQAILSLIRLTEKKPKRSRYAFQSRYPCSFKASSFSVNPCNKPCKCQAPSLCCSGISKYLIFSFSCLPTLIALFSVKEPFSPVSTIKILFIKSSLVVRVLIRYNVSRTKTKRGTICQIELNLKR